MESVQETQTQKNNNNQLIIAWIESMYKVQTFLNLQ